MSPADASIAGRSRFDPANRDNLARVFGAAESHGMWRQMKRFRWRDYRTVAGGRPVKEFIDALTDEDAAAVVAAMKEVAVVGLSAARHLHGDIYEVRAESERRAFRLLFAKGTKFILLSLHGFALSGHLKSGQW